MSIFKRNLLIAATVGASLLLSACDGVGSGSKPESLRVLPRDGNLANALSDPSAPVSAGRVYTCLRSAVGLYVTFTDGSIGDFSSRATWVSDDTDVVRISSVDKPEPVPGSDGLFYSGGTLIPVAPGSTMLTANYLGMSATLPVNVVALDVNNLVIEPATAVMAPTTFQAFRVTATVDQAVTDVTQFATFAFGTPDTAVATLDSSGNVGAVAASGTALNLEARFTPECTKTPTATVRVAEPTALRIEGEDNFYDPATPAENRLAVGYSEALKLTASFAGVDIDGVPGDDEQDVSRQFGTVLSVKVTAQPDDGDPLTTPPAVVSLGSPQLRSGSLMTGMTEGTVEVSARFGFLNAGPDGVANTDADAVNDDVYRATTTTPVTRRIVVGAIDPASTTVPPATLDPINSLAVVPAGAVIDDACGTLQFTARGNFTPADAVPLVHDVTRHVLWSLDAEAVALPDPVVTSQLCSPGALATAFIDNSANSLTPGRARSFLAAGASSLPGITVTALRVRGSLDSTAAVGDIADISQTATLDINPPAVAAAP